MRQFGKYLASTFLALALITLVGCAATASKEGTGEYFDDSVITAKVKASILDQPMLKVLDIKVDTFKGIVHLSEIRSWLMGFGSSAEVRRAAEVARGVPGVKSVRNDLKVR